MTFFGTTFKILDFWGRNFSTLSNFMSKIGQNNFQSNRGKNIPKINDLVNPWFLHYTTDFYLWFSLILVWDKFNFPKFVQGVPQD